MHHHFPEAKDSVELIKVGTIGLSGYLASINLADANLFMSFMVALATFLFIVTKSVFMVMDRKERKRRKRIEDLD